MWNGKKNALVVQRGKAWKSPKEVSDSRLSQPEHYTKPVVMISAYPKPKNATPIAGRAMMYLFSPVIFKNYEYKKDFQSLQLVNAQGQEVCKPLASKRAPFSTEYRGHYFILEFTTMADNSFFGQYEYDPKCFQTGQELFLTAADTSGKAPVRLAISDTVKQGILSDFVPYWTAIENQRQPVIAKQAPESPLQEFIENNSTAASSQ